MIKEFILCGIRMVADISGSGFAASVPILPPPQEAIANDWQQVGVLLDHSTHHPVMEQLTVCVQPDPGTID